MQKAVRRFPCATSGKELPGMAVSGLAPRSGLCVPLPCCAALPCAVEHRHSR